MTSAKKGRLFGNPEDSSSDTPQPSSSGGSPRPKTSEEPEGCGASSTQELRQQLEEAAEDLLYPSESDYPFTYIELPPDSGPEPKAVLQWLNLPARTPVEPVEFTLFFRELDPVPPPEDPREAREFHRLEIVLQDRLEDLRVLRIGEVEVQVYLLGREPGGRWVGLQTTSIET